MEREQFLEQGTIEPRSMSTSHIIASSSTAQGITDVRALAGQDGVNDILQGAAGHGGGDASGSNKSCVGSACITYLAQQVNTDILVAYFLLSLSTIFYGVMYAPARKYHASDGVIFQFLMSIGVVGMGWVLQCGSVFFFRETVGAGLEGVWVSAGSYWYNILFQGVFLIIPAGLLGGLFWSVANAFVLITVKFLGLGVGFTLYHAINLTLGYCIGKYQLFGVPAEQKKTRIQDFSLVINVFSFVLVMCVESSPDEQMLSTTTFVSRNKDYSSGAIENSTNNSVNSATGGNNQMHGHGGEEAPRSSMGDDHTSNTAFTRLEDTDPFSPVRIPSRGRSAITVMARGDLGNAEDEKEAASRSGSQNNVARKKAIGTVFGIVAGFFTSVNMVPYMNWIEHRNGTPIELFVFSQTLGIFLVSGLLFAIYYLVLTYAPVDVNTDKVLGLCKKKQLQKVPPFWAAAASGALWTGGFFCSLDGVKELGMGIGYVITAVGPVAVSGLISTLFFNEIQVTKHKCMFWCSIGLQAVAQGCLILGAPSDEPHLSVH